VASDYDDDDEDYDVGTELPDAAELSSSRLTETTFKLYALDHMTRETARVMRALRALNAEHSRSYGSLGSFLAGPIPALAALFPEYRVATAGFSQPVNSLGSSRNMNRNSDNKDDTPGDATPRASGFRTNSERQAARLGDATPKASHRSPPESQPQDRLAPYTIPTLLVTPRLRDLAVRIVDARARNEEKHRRRREKLGTSTARDAKIVASRIARGLDAGAYKLSCTERKAKMSALAAWAIQQAHAEGGLVDVRVPTTGDTWGAPETAYLPLPPELLAPLLAPLVSAAHADARGTFRSRLERAGAAPEVSPQAVTARLRAWGADGRWERVGAWAVEAAMEWGEAHGVI
jgi:hypothetical protein